MKITELKRVDDYEIKKWLFENLDLTDNQKRDLYERDFIRFSPYYFYKRSKKENVNILWRLTLLVYPIYLILAISFVPIKWMFTGKWGYGRNFIDNFHSKWTRKLGL